MARCISPHAAYSLQVIEGQEQVVVDARGYANTITLSKPVIANFEQGGLLDHEIEAALEKFNFSGVAEGVNPLTTIGSWDSEAFVQKYPDNEQNEMLVQIDQRLKHLQELHPNDFLIVSPPVAARPWPKYDEFSVEDILKFQERLGVTPEDIRLYEVANANRPEVVYAMLALDDPEGAVKYADAHPVAKPVGGLTEYITTNVAEPAVADEEVIEVDG